MKLKVSYSMIMVFATISITNTSCTRCETCIYKVDTGTNIIEEPLGEYCGDEIRALENREYNDIRGDARTECE